MSLVTPGKYMAHPERLSEEKFADVYLNQNGNFVLCMAFRLDESGHVLKHYWTLAMGQELRLKTIEDLKARFGWDGLDPFWFETADLSDVQVEAVIEDEQDRRDPNKYWTRIKWINDPGGRGGSYEPRQVDRRAVMSQYGSLFRAVAGPQPMTAATPNPAPAPPAPTAPKPPAPPAPAATVKPSDLGECWQKMCEATADLSDDDRAKDWFAIQKEIVPDKTQDDFTPDDWGRVLIRIEKMAKSRAMLGKDDDLPY